MQEIPFDPTLPNQYFGIVLSGVLYTLRFRWNPRASGGTGAWYCDILDASGNVLAASLKIVADWNPVVSLVGSALPAKPFFVYDTSGKGLDPGRDELGDGRRVRLYYDPLG